MTVAVIIAVRKAGKGQALWSIGGRFGHAIEVGKGGYKSDLNALFDKALGELEAGIDMSLARKR
jgi:hypothetical protein